MAHATCQLLVIAMFFSAPFSAGEREFDKHLADAMRGQPDTRSKIRAIAEVAWSEDTSEALGHHARKRVIENGAQALSAIAGALTWAEPQRFADIMLASIEAEQLMSIGSSPDTLAAIDRCIWFGPPDAQRLAMEYMAKRPVHIMLNPVIDVAYENPQLTSVVIDTLALMRDPRARFFLADRAQTGSPAIRRRAAQALAAIGGRSLEYLRAWALSEDPAMRKVALRALIPVSKIGDLTTLYEYLALFPEDDPEILDQLRARAEILERAILAQEEMDSRTPAMDD